MRQCAERCAAEYVELSQRQGWCHQQISIAREFLGERDAIVDWPTWNRYFVPGSYGIPVLKSASREENSVMAVASQDRLSVTRQKVIWGLKEAGEALLGGWPL